MDSDALTFIAWMVVGALVIIVIILVATRQELTVGSREEYCTACGIVGYAQFRKDGSASIEILLWLLALLPGLIYSIWRRSTERWVCEKCGSTSLIPVDSPKARAELKGKEGKPE